MKRFIIPLLLVAMCVGAANYITRHLSGPASGAVVTKQRSDSPQTKPARTYELDGDYLSFTYPSSFTISEDQAAAVNILQQNRLSTTAGGSQLLVLTVTSLPGGGLDDDPSYHMRKLHPETYELTSQIVNQDHVEIAARQASFEEVAFWPHAGRLATIALSGITTNQSATEAMFQSIIQSVTWQ